MQKTNRYGLPIKEKIPNIGGEKEFISNSMSLKPTAIHKRIKYVTEISCDQLFNHSKKKVERYMRVLK